MRSMVGPAITKDMGKFTLLTQDGKAPTITVKAGRKASLRDMVAATEEFRIKRMLLLCRPGSEDKVRRKAIEYLLKCWDLLTDEQSADVINYANRMLGAGGVDEETKVGIAIALKNFIGTKDSKKEAPMTFEQLRTSGGHIHIGEEEEGIYNDEPLL